MRYLAAFAYSHTDVPHSTVQLLKDHGGQSGIANEICREVDRARSCGAEKIFLSCEALGDLRDRSAWAALRDLLSGAAVEVSHVIVCLRSQHARFLSGLSESCRNGRNRGDIESLLPKRPLLSALNYASVLEPISSVFGCDRLHVINYDRQRDQLLPMIYAKVGIRHERLKGVKFRNSSYSPVGRLVYSVINKSLSQVPQVTDKDQTPNKGSGGALIEEWRSTPNAIARRDILEPLLRGQFQGKGFLRDELLVAKKLETIFGESNELLRKEYFPSSKSPLFLPLQMQAMEVDALQVRVDLESIVPKVDVLSASQLQKNILGCVDWKALLECFQSC